jgi:hypothetical protein
MPVASDPPIQPFANPPTKREIRLDDAPKWLRCWWKLWVATRRVRMARTLVRSPLFVMERRGYVAKRPSAPGS